MAAKSWNNIPVVTFEQLALPLNEGVSYDTLKTGSNLPRGVESHAGGQYFVGEFRRGSGRHAVFVYPRIATGHGIGEG